MEAKEILIEKSHKRSEFYGVERECNCSKKILQGQALQEVLRNNTEFIDVAKPYVNMIVEALQDSNFIVILTDNKGCILYIVGEEKITEYFRALDIKIGAYMDEGSIGTNAMGTAIKEMKGVQITAEEHYANIFQGLTCSAAPILNPKGEIIGTLNLTGKSEFKHPHTLGLVIFGVKAIENEFHKIRTNEILSDTYIYMKGIIDNVEKGFMITDLKGKIKDINRLACEYFGAEKSLLLGDEVKEIIHGWNNVIFELRCKDKTIEKEVKLRHNSKYITQLEIKGIHNNDNLIGVSIVMKNKEEKEGNGLITGAFCEFDDIIGSSDAITNLKINCKVIANSPSTILIQGESGTGKEILAQAIHNYSLRRNNKFVAINCGAIPYNIFESELFGYEEGTFTGAKKGGKEGKLEAANGGTLFLDEIGEMPIEMQVKLLRVIQEGRVTRVGGLKEIPLDIRIIAATNRNLREEVKNGKFREDLYYRLCVIPITIPPLRERIGDVEKLIKYFLTVKSIKLNKPMLKMDEELYHSLLNYNWPGNIRQLENYIENIVNLEGKLSFNLLEDNNKLEEMSLENKNEIKDDSKTEEFKKEFNLEVIEKNIIVDAIKYHEKNLSKVAKSLGISRNTLYLKVKKYNIEIR